MVCLWCGKQVGLLRSVVDREFCSQVHRRLASKSPDRIAKDIDVTSDYDLTELWTVDKENKRQARNSHQAVGVFAVLGILTLGAVGLATGGANAGPGGGGVGGQLLSLNPKSSSTTGWGDSVRSLWKNRAQLTYTQDFTQGFSDFVGGRSAGKRDWSFDPTNGLRPGKLRLWKLSTSLSDYEVDFQAQIEQKSLGWAYRAVDVKNYYGSKLMVGRTNSAEGPNTSLMRFVMVDGREQDRTQLPLPVTLERGTPMQIHLSVQGSRFTTAVNRQVVSSWSDSRLARGGLGFFSDDGEVASVRWVSLAERDSTLGRLLSHLSFIQIPSLPYYEDIDIGR